MTCKILLSLLFVSFFAGSSYADIIIEYTLNGDWVYEERNPGTLSLTDDPDRGVSASITVPSFTSHGGLTASRHDLNGFSIDSDTFIELSYNSLTSDVTGDAASLGLCIELEFIDSELNSYEIAMAIGQRNGSLSFVTYYEIGENTSYTNEVPIPPGRSVNEGALGLFFHDNFVSAYFKDAENNITYPFPDWNISQIKGANSFCVDNDFQGETPNGGTVSGSIILERVIYGVGNPGEGLKLSPWIPVLLLDK